MGVTELVLAMMAGWIFGDMVFMFKAYREARRQGREEA